MYIFQNISIKKNKETTYLKKGKDRHSLIPNLNISGSNDSNCFS